MADEKTRKGGAAEAFGDLLAVVLGSLEPERKMLGHWIAGQFGPDSVVRQREEVRRVIGALNQWLERRSGTFFGPLGRDVYERGISDVVDAALTELVNGGEDGEKKGKVPPWIPGFLKEALEDIVTAPDPEMAKEEQLRRFKIQLEFQKAVDEELKPPEPERPERQPIDWRTKWRSVKEEVDKGAEKVAPPVGRLADRLEAYAERRRQGQEGG